MPLASGALFRHPSAYSSKTHQTTTRNAPEAIQMLLQQRNSFDIAEAERLPEMRTSGPRRRRLVIYVLLVVAVSWSAIHFLLADTSVLIRSPDPPLSTEEDTQINGLLKTSGFKGLNARPPLKDMIQISDLPSKYLPGTGAHHSHSQGRLVMVGDVHGQKRSLVKLLDKVGFNEKRDYLIFVGDMISKGPDSAGVVDLAIELGASAVRGNHEDRVLLADAAMAGGKGDSDMSDLVEDEGKKQVGLGLQTHDHGDSKDKVLAQELGGDRLRWLSQWPVILRVGKLGDLGEVIVVHAGLAPGLELEKQDPMMVMNMRTIDKHGIPSNERDGMDWSKVWNKFQRNLPEDERTTVVYGHDQKRGLQLHDYSFGIDTGCIKGGKLTALVLEGGVDAMKHSLVQVKCKDGT